VLGSSTPIVGGSVGNSAPKLLFLIPKINGAVKK